MPEPSGYALVIRKGPQAQAALFILRAELLPVKYREDDDLVLCVMGGRYHLQGWLERIERLGLARGRDFVVVANTTSSEPRGVIGTTPDWLDVMVLPSGNPPELEAKMEPDVRAFWENSRWRTYALKKAAP